VGLGQARNALRRHPQGDILSRLGAVQFCRAPAVWTNPAAEPVHKAAEVARFLALDLLPPTARQQAFETASDRERTAAAALNAASILGNFVEIQRASWRLRGHQLATELLNAAGKACAAHARSLAGSENARAQQHYQTAIYLALAVVPPLVVDAAQPKVEVVREVEKKNLPPMKLPRGKFRRIVVRGRPYGWMAGMYAGVCDILVRSADNTGQRLVVRPLPSVVLPGLVARIMADALDGGWQPTVNDLPDFAWDGTPYLPPTGGSLSS
jgi:hypothetical protein